MTNQVKLFKNEDGSVRKVTNSFSVLNLLTKEDCDTVSVAVGTAKNHFEITTPSSARAYFILEGKMIVNKNIVANAGDVIFAPAHTTYHFEGTFKAVIINSPAFRKSTDKITEIKE
jgi:ethanolamine utilization protein EutQ (cupin superfamily)